MSKMDQLRKLREAKASRKPWGKASAKEKRRRVDEALATTSNAGVAGAALVMGEMARATRARRGEGLPGVDLERVSAGKSVAAGIRELMSQSPRAGEKVGVREREFIEKRPRAVVKKGRPAAPVQRMSAAEKASLDETVPVRKPGRPRGEKTVSLPLRLSAGLVGRLDREADRLEIPRASLIRRLLEKGLPE